MTQGGPEPEREALGALAERLRGERYAVDVEELPARPPEPWLAAYGFLSAIAALLIYPAPLLAALVGLAAVVLHARESEGRPLLLHGADAGLCVLGRSPTAARPALVVMARPLATPDRLPPSGRRALIVTLQTAMAAISAAGAAAWVSQAETDVPGWVAGAGTAAAVLVAALSALLHRPRPRSEAASASPAAELLLRLAPLLREHPVWLLVVDSPGVPGFLDTHPEIAGADWLNLETHAGDGVVAVSEEGTWRERRANRFLVGAAEEAGAEVRPHRAAPTSATPLLARRRRALTLLVDTSDEGLRIAAATAQDALSGERP